MGTNLSCDSQDVRSGQQAGIYTTSVKCMSGVMHVGLGPAHPPIAFEITCL